MLSRRWIGLLALALAGCATDLSTLQTAKTLPSGKFAATTSVGLYQPLGAALGAISQGDAALQKLDQSLDSGQPYVFTVDDQQDLLSKVVALAVLPPSAQYELTIRAGIAPSWDLGVRYGLNAARVDVKHHLASWDEDEAPWPIDLAIGFAFSRYFANGSSLSRVQNVRVDDFRRLDFELPLYLSAELTPKWTVYGAAKYVYSRTHLSGALVGPGLEAQVPLPGLVHTHFIGATVGARLRLPFFHLEGYAELTAGYTVLSPYLLFATRPLGGVTLFPAIGVGSPL